MMLKEKYRGQFHSQANSPEKQFDFGALCKGLKYSAAQPGDPIYQDVQESICLVVK